MYDLEFWNFYSPNSTRDLVQGRVILELEAKLLEKLVVGKEAQNSCEPAYTR